MLRLLPALALATIAASSYGQAINIKFAGGPPTQNPVPSPAFGAASGQAGVWNAAPFASRAYSLVDINGSTTAATMSQQGCPTQPYNWTDPALDADHHALLDSAWYQQYDFNDGLVPVSFAGLSNGGYTVYVYSYPPTDFADETRLVSCSPPYSSAMVTGSVPENTFAQGITHTVQHVTLTNGTLLVYVMQGDQYSSGYLNAIQLVPDVAAPQCNVSQQPASHEAVTGTTTTFTASISGDVRSLQWTKDGVNLTDTRGVTGSSTQTLTISEVSPHDAGSYALKYTCGGSFLVTQPATLTVRPACGTADFNADGDIGTDADIEAFFRVLAGGGCQ